ncbi:hypothetical protein HUT18_14670 [Streptomyces sp. NA04227]|uniref:hypothetical protein n=1 Tax=Streptomyces sp. NA04227 TaxID=2742136 RepID=UPI0015926E70|nr:hypothetical protein [Streptomyces sp. NA04227]QKW07439.1 hypothetical protein HUT18_14670 [Streptomyces sp. NA04227]
MGVVVGAVGLAIGVPFGLLSAVLQDKITAKDPAEPVVTARYDGRDAGDRSVLFRGARELPDGVGEKTGCGGRAVARGAVDFQATPVRVEVTGVEGRTVVIKDIRAKVLRSATPHAGVVLTCPTQGSGNATAAAMELDEAESPALEVAWDDVQPFISTKRYFDGKFHYVESQKPEVFDVTSYTRTQDYDWVLEVVGSVDGRDRVWTLDNDGRPFHTAGALPAPPRPPGDGDSPVRNDTGRDWGVDEDGVRYRFFQVATDYFTELRDMPNWYRPSTPPDRCSPPDCPVEKDDG